MIQPVADDRYHAPPPGPQKRFVEIRDKVFNLAPTVFAVTYDELLASNKRTAVHARWAIATVLRDAGYSLPEIGKALGIHHTTAMDAIRKVTTMIAESHPIGGAVEKLKRLTTEPQSETEGTADE